MEKIALVERRKSVERDPTCCGNSPLQASQRRRSRSFVGGELRETNPRLSFVVCFTCGFLAYLYLFSLRSTWVCLSLCAGIITLLTTIYQGHSPSLVRARSQEELEPLSSRFLQGSGITPCMGWSNRLSLAENNQAV
jgi:hypothetical protein